MKKKWGEVCEVNPQTRRCKDQWFDIHCYKEFGANSICEKKRGEGTSKQKESVLQEKKHKHESQHLELEFVIEKPPRDRLERERMEMNE